MATWLIVLYTYVFGFTDFSKTHMRSFGDRLSYLAYHKPSSLTWVSAIIVRSLWVRNLYYKCWYRDYVWYKNWLQSYCPIPYCYSWALYFWSELVYLHISAIVSYYSKVPAAYQECLAPGISSGMQNLVNSFFTLHPHIWDTMSVCFLLKN